MKVVSILLCALLVSYSSAATITLLPGVNIPLLCGNPCDLSSRNLITLILSGTLGAGDALVLQPTSAVAFNFSSAVQASAITFGGAAGSSLTLGAAATVDTLSMAAGTTINILGTTTANALTIVNGTLNIANGAVLNANGGINASANAGGINVQSGATLNIGASSTINSTLNIAANSVCQIKAGTTTLAGSTTAQGRVIVDTTLALAAAAAIYTQSQGTLVLSTAATSTINGNVALSGGNLTGEGTISGNLAASAGSNVIVGSSPGTVFVNGDFSMDTTSTFDFEASSALRFDKLIVKGKATVDGFLVCHLLDNYVPEEGASFTFITSVGASSGKFLVTRGDSITTLSKWSSTVNNNNIAVRYGNSATVATASFVLLAATLFLSML